MSDDEPITQADIDQEALRQDLVLKTGNLSAISGFLGAIFTVIGVIGIIGGIAIAISRTSVFEIDGTSHLEHRNVPLGVAVALGSVLQIGLVLIFTKTADVVANYVRYQVE